MEGERAALMMTWFQKKKSSSGGGGEVRMALHQWQRPANRYTPWDSQLTEPPPQQVSHLRPTPYNYLSFFFFVI